MAVTAIWDVKDNLQRVLDYTSNPEKSGTKTEEKQTDDLNKVIAYTSQSSKTDEQVYVTGLNCSLETAFEEMSLTKKQFHKEDSILAFHAYQSFQPGELDADLAHQIGVELAQRCWGDRFEVLICTHLDRDHIHNHFVINSVSFKDGYRYYDNKATYCKMRDISDELCRKYNLSVIENPGNDGMHYSEWNAQRLGKPTVRAPIRNDIDYCINHSSSINTFYEKMEKLGYKFKFGKHVALLPPGKSKYIRLRSLGDERYLIENIESRINEIQHVKHKSLGKKQSTSYLLIFGDSRQLKGFMALYYKYMYMMGILPEKPVKMASFSLREDMRYMDEITKEVTFISKNNIETQEDLEKYRSALEEKMASLLRERRSVYNKIKRAKRNNKPVFAGQLETDRDTLSERIEAIRKDIKLCDEVKSRAERIQTKLDDEEKEPEIETTSRSDKHR